MQTNKLYFTVAFLLLIITMGSSSPGLAALDPQGCRSTPLTNSELRSYGYEPVTAFGATPNDNSNDDTASIQAAINEANLQRRVVYFHPGEYTVSNTLILKQDIYQTNNNSSLGRFGQILFGSYCGEQKPIIRLVDNVDNNRSDAEISAEPTPVILLMRPRTVDSTPDDSESGRDWNQLVRNLRLVLGNNSGAVGIRHRGAEGSSVQEVEIDASGGFAGLYHLNSSGGYSYDVEITGGKYGVFAPTNQGGSTLMVGLKLSGQTHTPIVVDHFAPLTIVGFDITHNDGAIVSGITGSPGSYAVPGYLRSRFHDSGGHLSMVDGKIEITSEASNIINNQNTTQADNRSIYLKNVFFKGATKIIQNQSTGGNLLANSSTNWTRVSEYSYSGDYLGKLGEYSKLIEGMKTDQTYFNGNKTNSAADITVTDLAQPDTDLVAKHLYPAGLCNVEAADQIFVNDYGADPSDQLDDTAAIQAAIDAAETAGTQRVFLPAGAANTDPGSEDYGDITQRYKISASLQLKSDTRLCGTSRYASILDATTWSPTTNSAVLTTTDDSQASTVIADFAIRTPAVTGSFAAGYNPHVYAIHWRAGTASIYRDVHFQYLYGDPGTRNMLRITDSGGGRWYGITQHRSFPPPKSGGVRPYQNTAGELSLSPESRHLLIEGTQQDLTFYPFHCQHHVPPGGSQCDIINAANVTIFAIKSESASTPPHMHEIIAGNPPELIPSWMRIINSDNISLIGYEGLAEQAQGRALIEVIDSSNITIANMGRRGNGLAPSNVHTSQDLWYFLKEINGSQTNSHSAQGFLSLFKSQPLAPADTDDCDFYIINGITVCL